MKSYFVRHGQTNYNILNLCNDDTNKEVHLTEFGKQQAEGVKEKFKNIKLDMVFISDFPRTRETAEIIIKDPEVIFHEDSRINDRKTGYEGKSVSDFFKELKSDIFNLKLKGGESFQEEKIRVFSFLDYLKKLSCDTVLVVTHGEILQIINGYYNKLSDQEMLNTKADNCQVFEFNI